MLSYNSILNSALKMTDNLAQSIHNILISNNDKEIPDIFNKLTDVEQILVYYLYRASIIGNTIVTQQLHRYGLDHINLFRTLNALKDVMTHQNPNKTFTFDTKEFFTQVESYYVFLWSNHGQYFVREHSNEKRTPNKLNLNLLIHTNILNVINYTRQNLCSSEDQKSMMDYFIEKFKNDDYCKSLFDDDFESTLTYNNDIEKSSSNIYSRNFLNSDYDKLTPDQQNAINNTFEKDATTNNIKVIPYCVNGKLGYELSVCVFWLKKAHQHVVSSNKFDKHMELGLEYLIQYLVTGKEQYFKKHSIEWLQSNNKVDYNFGFVEQYDDPKCIRGFFQADITVRTINIDNIHKILPEMELNMPFDNNFKRDPNAKKTVLNASINHKLFGSGHLGPIYNTAAYNLSNYADISEEVGCKQIIYPSSKSIEQNLNSEVSNLLTYSKSIREWSSTYDKDFQLDRDIWNLQCILHELGHASGRSTIHTFVPGDNMTIGGTTYKLGDEIKVTNNNVALLIGDYSAIEECRAEMIALYQSSFNLEKLVANGFLTEWLKVCTLDYLEDRLIIGMCTSGLNRIKQQSVGATEMKGAHALANSTIMNYLINGGGIKIIEEKVTTDNTEYTVPSICLVNKNQAKSDIRDLMIELQRIKSTADGVSANKLLNIGRQIYKKEYIDILHTNQSKVMGALKANIVMFPIYELKDNKVSFKLSNNIMEQIDDLNKLEYSLT
jgi:hypothetical protein